MIRTLIERTLILVCLSASLGIYVWSHSTKAAIPACHLSVKQDVPADCEKLKTHCSRKSGCKCKLRCDENGQRLPPENGRDECPSYCCESKCDCHFGCP